MLDARQAGNGIVRGILCGFAGAGAIALALGFGDSGGRMPSGLFVSQAEACCHAGRPPRREGTGRNRVVRPEGVGRNRVVRPGGVRPGANRPSVGARNQLDARSRLQRGRDAAARSGTATGGNAAAGSDGEVSAATRTAIANLGKPQTDQERIDGILGEAVLDALFDGMFDNPQGKTTEELTREAYDKVLADPRTAMESVLGNPNREASDEENQAARDAFERLIGNTTAATSFAGDDTGAEGDDDSAVAGGVVDDSKEAADDAPKAPPAESRGWVLPTWKERNPERAKQDANRDFARDLQRMLQGLSGKEATREDTVADAYSRHGLVREMNIKRGDLARQTPRRVEAQWREQKDKIVSIKVQPGPDDGRVVNFERKDGDKLKVHELNTDDGKIYTATIVWPDGMGSSHVEHVDERRSKVLVETFMPGKDAKKTFEREVWKDQYGSPHRIEETYFNNKNEARLKMDTVISENYVTFSKENSAAITSIKVYDKKTGKEVPQKVVSAVPDFFSFLLQ